MDAAGGTVDFEKCEFVACAVSYLPEDRCLTLTMLGSLGTGWEGAQLLVIPRDEQVSQILFSIDILGAWISVGAHVPPPRQH